MRKTLGQVCYPRKEQVLADPVKEKSRREVLMKWRRKQLAMTATAHVRRIVREDGLARSIEELHDKQGRPPPQVNLEKLIIQYKRLQYQHGWLSSISIALREMLRELDLVRFLKDNAVIEKDLIERKAAREDVFVATAQKDQEEELLPPKLKALIRQEVKRDIRRKEVRNARPETEDDFHLSMPRRMQDIMQFLFLEHLPEGVSPLGSDDPNKRYLFLFDALYELQILEGDLQSNMYDLAEYVESADLVMLRYE